MDLFLQTKILPITKLEECKDTIKYLHNQNKEQKG